MPLARTLLSHGHSNSLLNLGRVPHLNGLGKYVPHLNGLGKYHCRILKAFFDVRLESIGVTVTGVVDSFPSISTR